METTIEPKKADQKLSTVKPTPNISPMRPESQNKKVLISNVNNPKVSRIKGQVKNFNKGPKKALTTPKIKARIRIASHPVVWG
jgi:hypothetical protein